MSTTIDRSSMLSELQANRQRILSDKEKVLKLPGWDSLSARYRRLPWDSIKGLQGIGQSDDSTQEVGAAIDVLINACVEVLFQGEGTGLRYEQGLAKLYGDNEANTPPEVLMSVFADDEAALMMHAGEYIEWALRMETEASEALGKD